MKKVSRSQHSSLNELNITPLLDLAFVLLVIFIITTPQLVNNLEMNLPSGKPPPPSASKPKMNYIVVNTAGKIFLNDAELALPALKQSLTQLKQKDPELAVVVRGATNVDYQNVISVLDVLQQVEITKVGLATEAAQ
jgi:biopolymer transport protein ExbD